MERVSQKAIKERLAAFGIPFIKKCKVKFTGGTYDFLLFRFPLKEGVVFASDRLRVEMPNYYLAISDQHHAYSFDNQMFYKAARKAKIGSITINVEWYRIIDDTPRITVEYDTEFGINTHFMFRKIPMLIQVMAFEFCQGNLDAEILLDALQDKMNYFSP